MTTTFRRCALAAAAVLAAAAGVAAVGVPAGAESGADAVEACQPASAVPEIGPRTCKSLEAGVWLAADACRRLPGTEEDVCPAIDGRTTGDAAMAEHEASWLALALDLQRELDHDVPLLEALIPSTHNSANSAAYDPTVTSTDANQIVSLTDQLRLGIRGIEIDIHWAPNPAGDPAQGGREVVQCHGEPVDTGTPAGTVHAGCSVDRTLAENLAELRAWLDDPAHDGELVLLYLENALDGDEAAHARAVEIIDDELGDLVFRPTPGAGCQPLPLATESKGSILATGARVLITGNCGPGGWTDRVFERGPAWDESGSSTGYDCAVDRVEHDYATTFVRRYEDSTWLSATAGGGSHITPDVLAAMVGCGVNLPGLDQVHPGDDRLPSLVWSWRHDEPAADAAGACAAQGGDARFFATDCAAALAVACRTADGGWAVTPEAVPWADGNAACGVAGFAGADVPVNGWDDGQLRAAAEDAGAADVWLAYAQDAGARWVVGMPDAGGPTDPSTPGAGHHGRPDEPGPPPAVGAGGHGRAQSLVTAPAATRSSLPEGSELVLLAAGVSLAVGSMRRVSRRRARRRGDSTGGGEPQLRSGSRV